MGLSLRPLGRKIKDIGSRAIDQVNPLDSGRTWKQRTPTNNRSVLGQATHNAVTNTIGNVVVKPFILNPGQTIVEGGRMATAVATKNQKAQAASLERQEKNVRSSLPYSIGSTTYETLTLPVPLVKKVAADISGNKEAYGNAENEFFKKLNKTPVGKITNIAQRNAADYQARRDNKNLTKEQQKEIAAKNLEEIGLDPKASLGKQWLETGLGVAEAAAFGQGSKKLGERRAYKKDLAKDFVNKTRTQNTLNVLNEVDKEKAAILDNANAGMRRVGAAQSKARAEKVFSESIAPTTQKQLPAPKQNFTMPRVDNEAYARGIKQLTKEYDTAIKSINDTYNPMSREYRQAMDAVDESFSRRHADLLANVGEFAQQTPKKPSVKLKQPTVKQQAKVAERIQKTEKPVVTAKSLSEKTKANTPAPADYGPVKTEAWYNKAKPIVTRLRQMGGGAAELAKRLVQKREYGETQAYKVRFSARKLEALTKDEFAAAVDVLEGKTTAQTPRIAEAASLMKQIFDNIYDEATASGIPLSRRENYFPHFADVAREGSSAYQRQINHLMSTGQARNAGEATALLERTRQINSRKKFGSFENERKADLPDYPKTIGALHHYIDESYSQIAHAKTFGHADETLNSIMDSVYRDNPGSAELVRKLFDEADGRVKGSPLGNKVANVLTAVQGATKLGSSALGNVAQNVNTAIKYGATKTAKNIGKNAYMQLKNQIRKVKKDIVRDGTEEALIRKSGVISEGVTREAINSQGNTSAILRKATAPLFEWVEKDNRRVAALTGKDVAESLAKKYSVTSNVRLKVRLEKALRDLGVEGDIGPNLTESQILQAMRTATHKTQFRTGAMDLPRGATGPIGRVVTQFKRYPYKQSEFLVNEVLKPTFSGDFEPILRAIALTYPVGRATSDARNAVNARDTSNDTDIEKFLGVLQAGGGTGIETSLIKELLPKKSDNTYGADYSTRVAKTVGGPTVSDAIDLANNTSKAAQGNSEDLVRMATRRIPVVGQRIANQRYPYGDKKISTSSGASATSTGTTKDKKALDKESNTMLEEMRQRAFNGDRFMNELPNGRIAVAIGNDVKVFDKVADARKAARIDRALEDGSESKVLGDTYYYKDENGDTKSMKKYKHDFDVADSQNQLDMYVAKETEDYAGWLSAANKQLTALETLKAKYNKDSQEDKVDDVQKKIEQLKVQMAKYKAYGGFTKPKKGGSGSGNNPYKYTVSMNAGGQVAKPKVAAKAGTRFVVKQRGSSVSPTRVSLKKSMV